MRSLKSPPSHGVWGSNHPLVLQLKGKVCLACSSMFYKQKPYLVGVLFCIGCISASKSRTPDVPQAWMNLYYQYYNNLKHKLQKSLFIWVACFIKTDVTPFFPGIAHSQFMRFMVPSAFFVGTATNPWNQGRRFCKQGVKDHILTIYQELRVRAVLDATHKRMVLPPRLALLGKPAECNAWHDLWPSANQDNIMK